MRYRLGYRRRVCQASIRAVFHYQGDKGNRSGSLDQPWDHSEIRWDNTVSKLTDWQWARYMLFGIYSRCARSVECPLQYVSCGRIVRGKALLMVEAKPVVLCVDDEEIPLLLRKLVLEKAGYDVVTASSVLRALEIVSTRHVDLVLSDHLMPGSTGTELARQIKSRLPQLPVVLLSGVNEV